MGRWPSIYRDGQNVLALFGWSASLNGMPRSRRILPPTTIDAAMEAAGECRKLCVQVLTEAPIGGPAYKAAGEVMDAIDKLAEALTGERKRFWLKPHGGSFPGIPGR